MDSGVLSPEMSPRPAEASLDGVWAVLFFMQHKSRSTTGGQKVLSHCEAPKDPWDVTLLHES